MELIERYLQAIGWELPEAKRADIVAELRSSLYDALDAESDGAPTEEQAVALIKQMGSPQQVAAGYYPAGQYLIGPVLYPLFVMVIKIVFTVVVTVQLVLTSINFIWGGTVGAALGSLGELVGSLTFSLGMVVLVFWALQRYDVRPAVEEFDPRTLPPLEPEDKPIRRGEHIFNIAVNVVVLTVLLHFARQGGFPWFDQNGLLENPVLVAYMPLIAIAMLTDIVLEIVVLGQGRWQFFTRAASLAVNLFGLVVALLVLQAHDAWLAAQGAQGLFESINLLPVLFVEQNELTGMMVFRFIFAIATVVAAAETFSSALQLSQAWSRRANSMVQSMLPLKLD